MSEEGTTPWALQCQECGRFVDWRERLGVVGEEAYHHNDFNEFMCGPVRRVELRSDGD